MNEPTHVATQPAKAGDEPLNDSSRDYGTLIVLGLAAASIGAVIELATSSKMDCALTFALYCFAVSIPVNIACGLVVHPRSGLDTPPLMRKVVMALFLVGICVAFAGFTGLFWHFSVSLGALFLIWSVVVGMGTTLASGAYVRVRNDLSVLVGNLRTRTRQ